MSDEKRIDHGNKSDFFLLTQDPVSHLIPLEIEYDISDARSHRHLVKRGKLLLNSYDFFVYLNLTKICDCNEILKIL